MSDLEINFQKTVECIKTLSQVLSNEELLELYGLYKQAILGNNNTNKPSIFNYRGLKKWQSWASFKDITSVAAKTKYILLVQKLVNEYS